VEQIIAMKEEDGVRKFLVKYRGRSHLHVEWLTEDALRESDPYVLAASADCSSVLSAKPSKFA
jgi:hypothetical protein